MPLCCPNCKGMLNQRVPAHCPNCGAEVRNVEIPAKSMAEQVGWKPIQAEHDAATATTEQLAQRLESLEGVVVVTKDAMANALQRLATAELTIKRLRENVESVDVSASSLIRGLHAEIAGLKESLKGDPCLPACECQPAAKTTHTSPCPEFTVEQMAAAIDAILIGIDSAPVASWNKRALRAARDHILAGKADA